MTLLVRYLPMVATAYLTALVVHEASHWFVARCFGVTLHWRRLGWRIVFDFEAPTKFTTLCIKRAGFAGEVLFGFLLAALPSRLVPFGLDSLNASVGFLALVVLRVIAYRVVIRDAAYNDFAPMD